MFENNFKSETKLNTLLFQFSVPEYHRPASFARQPLHSALDCAAEEGKGKQTKKGANEG